MIGDGSCEGTADDAAYQGTSGGPADAGRIEMKQSAQIADRAADDDVVVTEKQPAQGRDAGRDDERSARMRLGGTGRSGNRL